MYIRLITVFVILSFLLGYSPANAETIGFWRTIATPMENGIGDIWIGTVPGYQDGYDGQHIAQVSGSGIALFHYRQTNPGWSGPEGFYWEDYESPIPAGGNHTWSDIYLWTQDYAVSGQTANILFGLEFPPPPGYTAHLVLDYVPDSLHWTGQTDFWLDLTRDNIITLPTPEVNDGLLGTRMHLTVYAPAVPEPSSLASLGLGLLPLAGYAVRRRK